jgi:predicted phage terminase large subunit-like protein
LQLSPQAAAQLLLKRRAARDGLIPFTELTFPKYRAADHHRLIAEHLEQVERGEIDRLLITMPPRHGKSELASRRFPAWYLGRNPNKDIISASYNMELGTDFGRDVRNIMREQVYKSAFPDVGLSPDSTAAGRFSTPQGGKYNAAGVGTAVTGRGAHILLIDDPLKDREEAESERRRDTVWNWYTSTAYTRLQKGGAIIVIQTRWHEDDLAGRLLAAQAEGKDSWTHLDLPALSGDVALWPEEYPKEVLERIRDNIGPRDWSALYQQQPAPDEGALFKRDWFRYYTDAPKELNIYAASDYAVTNAGGDYTVHIIAGVDPNDNIYLLDLWREQTSADVWIESAIDLAAIHKPLIWGEEGGVIIKSIGPALTKRQEERRVYYAREPLPSMANKEARAQSISARYAMGKVYHPANAPWLADLEREMLSFPYAKHDDQVDALSLLGRLLTEIVPARVPAKDRPAKRKRYDIFTDSEEESWTTI